MADKQEKPKTVTMEALEYHTYNGEAYEIGDTYELDEQLVDSVTHQGKAVRVDRVANARRQSAEAKRAEKPVKAAKAKGKGRKGRK